MIVTFYSYKGGVGRSMAIANIAKWFELKGIRVILVDWDLEAPGLESFFTSHGGARRAMRAKLGVIDLLTTYKDVYPSLPKPTAGHPNVSFADVLDDALPPLAHMLIPLGAGGERKSGEGGLWLLPAGSRDGERFSRYAETVQQFDWTAFYTQYEGEAYFEWLRRQLTDPQTADVALIDSRTGVAEMSGVCTRHLADVVVVLCAPNDQNLEGVAMMVESFTRPDVIEARKGRPIRLVIAGARVDLTEGKPIDQFEDRFHDLLDKYLPEEFLRAGTSFRRLRIPYISTYAYSERLAVGDPDGVKAMQDAYESMALHIALLSAPSSALWQKSRAQLQEIFGFPTVYLDRSDVQKTPRAAQLVARLEQAGIEVLETNLRSPADPSYAELPQTKGGVSAILLINRESTEDRSLRDTWRRLRAQGVPSYLVRVGAADGEAIDLPPGLRAAPALDGERKADKLIALLHSRRRPPRVPDLAPPPPNLLLGRERELSELKTILLNSDSKPATAALVGLGGSGKSALARVFCADDEVVDRFPDGVLWLATGAQTNLRDGLAKWVAAFEGNASTPLDLEEAERRLTEHLRTRSCLIVLDDVQDPTSVAQIPKGPNCSVLITARAKDVAAALRARVVEIRDLSPEAASQLLLAGLPAGAYAPEAVRDLVSQLGGSPAAIAAACNLLRSRISTGEEGSRSLSGLISALRDEGLDALGEDWQASIGAFSAAIERLPAADRRLIGRLVSIPPDRGVSLDDLARLGVRLPTDMLQRLNNLSLIDFDTRTQTVVVPVLTHAFVRSLARREERAQQTIIASGLRTDIKVYISYRRDAGAQAKRLYDRLSKEFGAGAVMIDVASLSVGEDWHQVIDRMVGRASIMVVLISPSWGVEQQRPDDASDFVRLEVARALSLNIPVIPVLLDGASMPFEGQLPPDVKALTRRHAMSLSDTQFNQDADKLIQAIQVTQRFEAAAPPGRPAAAVQADWTRDSAALGGRTRDALPASVASPESRSPVGDSKLLRTALAVAAVLVLIVVGSFLYTRLISPVAGLTTPALPQANLPPGPEPSHAAPPQPSPSAGPAETLFTEAEGIYFGREGSPDYSRAFNLYFQAAALGYAPAENALGRMYENGQGVRRDLAAAMRWYKEAAAQGHPDAIAALNRLQSAALRTGKAREPVSPLQRPPVEQVQQQTASAPLYYVVVATGASPDQLKQEEAKVRKSLGNTKFNEQFPGVTSYYLMPDRYVLLIDQTPRSRADASALRNQAIAAGFRKDAYLISAGEYASLHPAQ